MGNYDLNFKLIDTRGDRNFSENLRKPRHWDDMIQIAKILSSDFPFVRVDLYDLEGKVYFGELTFTPANGMSDYVSREWDAKMGDLYDLSLYNQ